MIFGWAALEDDIPKFEIIIFLIYLIISDAYVAFFIFVFNCLITRMELLLIFKMINTKLSAMSVK